ncbi:Aste57867_19846 [Aphanomyces stellatus]|uniref:Aste57867_19846 protein n=1 Tax=Aphanomyces stellatus TaxID=120398 RepID=A0A485LE46_9STRA|nr:hypothetical protein As57867_019781 [Aphanomyces stellatus]VFT96544.1 Aste57867_19846 [Aphanomyces stellatus]
MMLRRAAAFSCAPFSHKAHVRSMGYPLAKQKLIVRMAQQLHDPTKSKHTVVPSVFSIPATPDWPRDAHGKNVDVSVFRTAHRRGIVDADVVAALDAVGFVWDLKFHRWSNTLLALEVYNSLHGDVVVPQNYIVPANDPSWPKELWTLRLGTTVSRLRLHAARLDDEQTAQLNAIGFVWDAMEHVWQVNLEALQIYYRLHGHVRVLRHCTIPDDDHWPVHCRGIKIGLVVNNIRSREADYSAARKAQLDALGFEWTPSLVTQRR